MKRAAAAGLVVLGVYVGLAFLNSPRGFLGTDTGGKVATFEAMSAVGRFDPDLGYWAERWDPEGTLHPIAYTSLTSSGRWVNVTTLPALWVGWQLYRVGGYRLSLLVPMAGSLAAAFAGLALLRRLGVRSEGWAWTGFFVLALASPLTIYALDFWEHSVGVALMAWAVVVLVDVVVRAGKRVVVGALAGGALFGAAATMRTEALVYLGVAGIVVVLLLARFGAGTARARGLAAIGAGALVLVGAAAPVLANEVFERRVVGDSVRSSRIAGTALGAGDLPADRVEEAATTLVGLEGSPQGIALGVGFVAVLAFAVVRRDTAAGVVAIAGAGGIGAVRAAASGFGFVPGVLPAWSGSAVAGVASTMPGVRFEGAGPSAMPGPRRASIVVWAVALGAIPLVLATQFRGGAGPQWAGRYLLLTGFLLAVAGLAAVGSRPVALRVAVVVLAVGVTGFGVAWLRIRSHDVARTIAALEARPEEVLVSDVFHLAREGGATYGDKRWLTLANGRNDATRAADVLTQAGIESFAAIETTTTGDGRRLDFPGFEPTDRTTLRLFDGVDLRITSWRATP